jgi:hypothetical protein
MLERWLQSCPELELLQLDVALGREGGRAAVAVNPLALRLSSPAERALINCLEYIAAGNSAYALEIAERAKGSGALLPDLHLLEGALLLGEGRIQDAMEPLRQAYLIALGNPAEGTRQRVEPIGAATRRLYPQLRLLLRVAPTQLLPLYPDNYAAGMLLAVALWHSGHAGEALDVLRETAAEFGLIDELRLVAGQIHLGRGDTAKAVELLAEPPEAEHDGLDFNRALYFGLAHLQDEDLKGALTQIRSSVLHTKDVNPHTHARGRVMVAQIYGAAGFPLEALRHSGVVHPSELPQFAAVWLAAREAQWVEQLSALSYTETEQLAHADPVSLHIPAAHEVLAQYEQHVEPIYDPLDALKPKEMSWARRREEEEKLADVRRRMARGEQVALGEPRYSAPARELRSAVTRMQKWWEQRQTDLKLCGPNALARDADRVAHLRFDLRGTRAAPVYNLPCERRFEALNWVAGAAAMIAVVLILLRSCSYGL